jgi:hypothetical protein
MNASQKEVELKLELPASLPSIKQLPLLKALKPSSNRAAEISVYFDTTSTSCARMGSCYECAGSGIAMSRRSKRAAVQGRSSAANGKTRLRETSQT